MPKPAAHRLLLVIRHAKAARDVPVADRERALTDEGRADVLRVAGEARRAGYVSDLVLCSPARRARETADLFCEVTGAGCEVRTVADLYPGSAEEALREIRRTPADVRRLLVVGHNPGLEDLVGYLAGPDYPHDHLPAGALACFSVRAEGWDATGHDTVSFLDLIRPKPLRP